jgi:hypothetical protein
VFRERQGRAGVSALELDVLGSGRAMMQVMKPAARFLALVLAAAVAAAPALLVVCAIACHPPARGLVEAQATSEHSCHEPAGASASVYHLRGHSRGCSHDHRQTAVRVAGVDPGTPNKSLPAWIAIVTSAIGSLAPRNASLAVLLAHPPGAGTASSFLLPLRI